jgi:hypothetical protein
MTVLKLFAAMLVCFVAGCGLVLLSLRDNARVAIVEAAALAWLLGSAFISAAVVVCGVWLKGAALISAVVALAVLLALMGATRARSPGYWLWPADGVFGKILTGCLLVPVVLLFVNSLGEPLLWDGLLIWEFKARIAALNGGSFPAHYFSSRELVWSHPGYPLYLPALEAWLYLCMGGPHQYWVKLMFPMFPAAGAAILWSAAARRSQKAAFGAVSASLLLLIPAVWNGAPGPLHGYADFPLAVFFLGACYVLIFRAGRHYNRAIPALLGACLPFVKTEGIFLWAAFATVALWTHRARLRQLGPSSFQAPWSSAPGK